MQESKFCELGTPLDLEGKNQGNTEYSDLRDRGKEFRRATNGTILGFRTEGKRQVGQVRMRDRQRQDQTDRASLLRRVLEIGQANFIIPWQIKPELPLLARRFAELRESLPGLPIVEFLDQAPSRDFHHERIGIVFDVYGMGRLNFWPGFSICEAAKVKLFLIDLIQVVVPGIHEIYNPLQAPAPENGELASAMARCELEGAVCGSGFEQNKWPALARIPPVFRFPGAGILPPFHVDGLREGNKPDINGRRSTLGESDCLQDLVIPWRGCNQC